MYDQANQEQRRRAVLGDGDARARLLRRRLRAGECSPEALSLAAGLGEEAAFVALDAEAPPAGAFAWQDWSWTSTLRNDHAQGVALAAARAASSVLGADSPARPLLALLDRVEELRFWGGPLDERLPKEIAEAGGEVARSLDAEAPEGPWWSPLTLGSGEGFREQFLREVAPQRGNPARAVHDLWVVAENTSYYDDLLGWVLSEGELTGALAWVHLTWGVQDRSALFPWTTVQSVGELASACSPQQAAAQALCFALSPATLWHCPSLNALAACAYAEAALSPGVLLEALQRDLLPTVLGDRWRSGSARDDFRLTEVRTVDSELS